MKPPPLTSRYMRFERHDKISRGPFSLELDDKFREVSLVSADHERGMVLILRLGMEYAWRYIN